MTARGASRGLNGNSKPPVRKDLTGTNQRWCWDISYLPTFQKGEYLFLYLRLDEWSRKAGRKIRRWRSLPSAWLRRLCRFGVPKFSRFDFWFAARTVPKAQDINGILPREHFVNDPIRPVDDFTDGWLGNFRGDAPALRQFSQRQRVVNKFVAKRLGASGIVLRDEGNDIAQIVQRLRREDYFAAHASTSLRASSTGTPSPRRACQRAFSMPASSSISRAISASEAFSGSLLTRSMTNSRLLMLKNYPLPAALQVGFGQ